MKSARSMASVSKGAQVCRNVTLLINLKTTNRSVPECLRKNAASMRMACFGYGADVRKSV